MCKLKPEILNIIKYALIVHLDNQWIFCNINKNFWLKLTHCENKSWKKLFPSFLNYCNQSIMFCALVQPDLGARTPMKRLDVGLIYQNRRRRLSLYFKNMHVVLQSEKLYMHSSFHNG